MAATRHGATIEKLGLGLTCSVETFRGCRIELVKRTSGFNGISTNKKGEVRKIEVKTMERSDNWIAINGLTAIDKLFFERDYWLYFVLLPENIVVMTKALPFIRQQLGLGNTGEFLEQLVEWLRSTKRLGKVSRIQFLPRINIKFTKPIRKLVKHIISEHEDKTWHKSVIEIWQNKETWERLFFSNEED
ncbi:MAG: hypothetical protein ABIK39_00535 [candidate division WOR-3 bacterium]